MMSSKGKQCDLMFKCELSEVSVHTMTDRSWESLSFPRIYDILRDSFLTLLQYFWHTVYESHTSNKMKKKKKNKQKCPPSLIFSSLQCSAYMI